MLLVNPFIAKLLSCKLRLVHVSSDNRALLPNFIPRSQDANACLCLFAGAQSPPSGLAQEEVQWATQAALLALHLCVLVEPKGLPSWWQQLIWAPTNDRTGVLYCLAVQAGPFRR